ncbi:MAG: hypothetical protein Unbinned5930contig1000_34 [Prokaryotic dsDNA virus sp.]|nr:MAG: hypothetical protein Unbinned5930contig1000_34 [Prokaryotic dsDNA virus sp.]|tara:strand:+ start:587 stop:838 length:252 start_codon:yes stop_codon:yes gene_type:complete
MPRINKYRTGKLRRSEQVTIDPFTYSDVSAELSADTVWQELTNIGTEGSRTTDIMYLAPADRQYHIKDGELKKYLEKKIRKRT